MKGFLVFDTSRLRRAVAAVCLLLGVAAAPATQADTSSAELMRESFMQAWQAARSGHRDEFERLGPDLRDYLLFPYWQYEDYRHRRTRVPPAEMAAFLDAHQDWAFHGGLKRSWLRSLGQSRRWQALEQYGAGQSDPELACYHARARLNSGNTDGLLAQAQVLWAVGKSQPDACDPLFSWLTSKDGISADLAWQRIRLAFRQGNPRLTLYLARFLPVADRPWLERWQALSRDRYRRLDRALSWPDQAIPRLISAEALQRLSRSDSSTAMDLFTQLDRHFSWDANTRRELMHEIALMAAVDLEPNGLAFIRSMPSDFRDDQLNQWWARLAMSQGQWGEVVGAIDQLSPESASDGRWRYWRARALHETGQVESARVQMEALAGSASYHGFLAADSLGMPYTICPIEPQVGEDEIRQLATVPGVARSLELHQADVDNWALAEWSRAMRELDPAQLRRAAALALQESWHDRAIFALGNSGDLRWYEWRFPLLWEQPVMSAAARHQLDPAWVFGVMRSESAMTESARSSAGALGLMQVTPATARQISRQHGLPYQNQSQLLDGPFNIRFGTVYMRQLLDEYGQNPVLVAGAYNAGPNAVKRWLSSRPTGDPTIWVETLPYYETRDYIPRVLAFTTIYNWRLQNPVVRVSSRMPAIGSGTMASQETTQVVCSVPAPSLAATGQ